MTQKAKIFQNGGSQAVRLPKNLRFPDGQSEVSVRRAGRQIVLEPADEWPKVFLDALGAWNEEIQKPATKGIATKRNPFG